MVDAIVTRKKAITRTKFIRIGYIELRIVPLLVKISYMLNQYYNILYNETFSAHRTDVFTSLNYIQPREY